MQDLETVLAAAPQTQTIQTTILTMHSKLHQVFGPVSVLVSGGSDSDIIVHLVNLVPHESTINYIFFDTGIEYQATKDHLCDLEAFYGISIHRRKAAMPVPSAVRRYGVPFLSKRYSDYIGRLQRHGFDWQYDITPDEGVERFGSCRTAMRWWCNDYGRGSSLNIGRRAYLKQYIAQHPPTFPISDKCCIYAKKHTSHQCDAEFNPELKILGIRRAEGGIRAHAYKTCFSPAGAGPAEYRPIFFWTDNDKETYRKHYGIQYSKCYTQYGLQRTGCAGCPLSAGYREELAILQQHEPKLYAAVQHVFHAAYDYYDGFRDFAEQMKGVSHHE